MMQISFFLPQVWHYCLEDGRDEPFLCPIGTVFNQRHFICDWWYNTDCASAQDFYRLNEELYQKYTEAKKSPVASRELNGDVLQDAASEDDAPYANPVESYGSSSGGYGRR